MCTALAAFVFASRCWLIAEWGSPVPFWDQWGVEGSLYRAWLTDSLHWGDLFAAHNEHRIALTKIADLALFIACDGWNPWVQQLLNAALHATTAGLLACAFWYAVSHRVRVMLVTGVGLLFCSTTGWQNALWGFQSQVYLCSLLAVVAFFGLTIRREESVNGSTAAPSYHPGDNQEFGVRRWIAFGVLLLALFSNAGGLLAVIVAFGVSWPRHRTLRAWSTSIFVAAVLIAGAALSVSAPQHAPLHARSVEQFWQVFARGLSWPHVNSAWAWIGMQFPIVFLSIRRRGSSNRIGLSGADRFAFALAAFAILQAAAVAYTRGAGLPEFRPLSRYQDPFLLGATAQLYAAARLAVELGRPGRLVLIGWSSLTLMGLISLTSTHLSLNLPYKRAQDRESLDQIRTYLRTSEVNVFDRGTSVSGPDSSPTHIIHVFDDPILRPVLPNEFYNDVPRPWPIEHYRVLVWVTALIFGAALMLSLCAKRRTAHRSAPSCDDFQAHGSTEK